MPLYSMRNTETGEEFEISLSMKEREEYLEENKHMKQIFNKFPAFIDPVKLGVRKHDAGFKEVLSKVKENHKYSTVDVK